MKQKLNTPEIEEQPQHAIAAEEEVQPPVITPAPIPGAETEEEKKRKAALAAELAAKTEADKDLKIPGEAETPVKVAVGSSSLEAIRKAHEEYNNSDKSEESYKTFQETINKNSKPLEKITQDGEVSVEGSEHKLKMVGNPGYPATHAVPSLNPEDLKKFDEISITRAAISPDGAIAKPEIAINAIYKDGKCTHFELPSKDYGVTLTDGKGLELEAFTKWKEANNDKTATDFLAEKAQKGEKLDNIVISCNNHPSAPVNLCTAEEFVTNMRSMGKAEFKAQEIGGHKAIAPSTTPKHHISAEEAIATPKHAIEVEEQKQRPHIPKLDLGIVYAKQAAGIRLNSAEAIKSEIHASGQVNLTERSPTPSSGQGKSVQMYKSGAQTERGRK